MMDKKADGRTDRQSDTGR